MSQLRTTVTLHVQPNAKHNEVLGFADDTLRLKIAAPPFKGKANRELVDFLSRSLGVSRSAVTIEKGLTSRDKVIAIEGLDRDSILERLGAVPKR